MLAKDSGSCSHMTPSNVIMQMPWPIVVSMLKSILSTNKLSSLCEFTCQCPEDMKVLRVRVAWRVFRLPLGLKMIYSFCFV